MKRWEFRRHLGRLSTRILLLFLITGAAIIMIVASLFSGAWKYHLRDAISPHLVQYVEYIKRDLGDPPRPDAAAELARRLPVDIVIVGPDVNWTSTADPIEVSDIRLWGHHYRHGQPVTYGEYDHDRFLIKTTIGNHDVLFLVAELERDGRSDRHGLILILVILLVLVVCHQVIRWLLKPIKVLEAGVQTIGSGNLDHRIKSRRSDELGQLARHFNQMASDIQDMLEAKRQLLLAISHELRSPLTRMNVSIALLDDDETRSTLEHDIREMETLVSQLLEAERLNTSHDVLSKEVVVISELVQEVIADHFTAEEIILQFQENLPVVALDPVRIKLLIKNLVENALRFNRPEIGKVTMSISQGKGRLELAVQDFGPGIESEKVQHMAEPFWRDDTSRQRRTGGYGLGLYLCRRIAQAHNGELVIESVVDVGTRMIIRIPIS